MGVRCGLVLARIKLMCPFAPDQIAAAVEELDFKSAIPRLQLMLTHAHMYACTAHASSLTAGSRAADARARAACWRRREESRTMP